MERQTDRDRETDKTEMSGEEGVKERQRSIESGVGGGEGGEIDRERQTEREPGERERERELELELENFILQGL